MIGLDAAEFTLIQQWMDEGWLPNMAAIQQRGTSGKLRSSAEWLVGAPWPCFYTSTRTEQLAADRDAQLENLRQEMEQQALEREKAAVTNAVRRLVARLAGASVKP